MDPRTTAPRAKVEYPESDGRPMGESDEHRDEVQERERTAQERERADRAEAEVARLRAEIVRLERPGKRRRGS